MKKQIGTVGVDAGQVIIVDPCHFKYNVGEGLKLSSKEKEDLYLTLDAWMHETVINLWKQNPDKESVQLPMGVLVRSGYGDGIYPVIADFTPDGTIKSVTIQFIKDDEE